MDSRTTKFMSLDVLIYNMKVSEAFHLQNDTFEYKFIGARSVKSFNWTAKWQRYRMSFKNPTHTSIFSINICFELCYGFSNYEFIVNLSESYVVIRLMIAGKY